MANDYYGNISGPQSCTSSRWLTEEVFKLIDMVQHDEAIYNPRHKYYFCRPYVETFWREVDQKLDKNPGASLAKWTNLRISFRREYTNYLEEKVPPCWTYFDRMFFLHPYLRKKHSQPKSFDSQVQDALVRISTLSNRFQRHRTTAATAAALNTTSSLANSATSNDITATHSYNQPHNQSSDSYLEYFDDPEHNNSPDIDDVADDEEHQPNFRHVEPLHHEHVLNSDIKSECDEVKSDVDEYDPESALRQDEVDNELLEEMEMRNFMMDSYASSTSTQNPFDGKTAHLRMQHLMRMQARGYRDESLRIKRPRSQENISSTQMNNSSLGSVGAPDRIGGVDVITTNQANAIGSSVHMATTATSTITGVSHTRMHYSTASTTSIHANVSFVRPTLAKPVELVSTTTNSSNNGNSVGLSVGAAATIVTNQSTNITTNDEEDINASSTSSVSNQLPPTSTVLIQHQRHTNTNHSNHNYNNCNNSSHRLEIASISSGSAGNSSRLVSTGGPGSSVALMNSPPISQAPVPTSAHIELCDCKTDPDAMFLMSLLPDIQKLNGRDRGKIKIAFQNILQDYLYPD